MLHNRLTRLREERENGEHGFTLIELLVVVVIIGILVAIAIPLYLNYKKGANDKSTQADVRNAVTTLEQCNADNNSYPSGIGTATGNSFTTLGGCTGGRINFSSNTTLSYTAAPTSCNAGTTPCTSFTLAGTSAASGSKWTYDSTTGVTTKTP